MGYTNLISLDLDNTLIFGGRHFSKLKEYTPVYFKNGNPRSSMYTPAYDIMCDLLEQYSDKIILNTGWFDSRNHSVRDLRFVNKTGVQLHPKFLIQGAGAELFVYDGERYVRDTEYDNFLKDDWLSVETWENLRRIPEFYSADKTYFWFNGISRLAPLDDFSKEQQKLWEKLKTLPEEPQELLKELHGFSEELQKFVMQAKNNPDWIPFSIEGDILVLRRGYGKGMPLYYLVNKYNKAAPYNVVHIGDTLQDVYLGTEGYSGLPQITKVLTEGIAGRFICGLPQDMNTGIYRIKDSRGPGGTLRVMRLVQDLLAHQNDLEECQNDSVMQKYTTLEQIIPSQEWII